MASRKIKKGDKVLVLTGRSKGQSGAVLCVMENQRLVVEGVNIVKKHTRPNPNKNEQGGIIEREGVIHCSNVALVDPTTSKAGKVGFKRLTDGKKVRCFKSSGEVIDS